MTHQTRAKTVPGLGNSALHSALPLPNILTALRLALAFVIAALIAGGARELAWIALVLMLIAAITDYLDGYIARRTGAQSDFGRVFDPVADKMLICGVLFAFASAGIVTGAALVPAIVILWRELFVSGLRDFMARRKLPLPVMAAAKWKTAVQMAAVLALTAGYAYPSAEQALATAGTGLLWAAASLSLYSACIYILSARRALQVWNQG